MTGSGSPSFALARTASRRIRGRPWLPPPLADQFAFAEVRAYGTVPERGRDCYEFNAADTNQQDYVAAVGFRP